MFVLLVAALLDPGSAAFAAGIDPQASHIRFTFRQMNVPVEGSFRKFRADIHFDAAQPERSRAEVEVDLAGIDTGSSEGDTEAKRKPWFDVASFPGAKFTSTTVRHAGTNRYDIAGHLSLKGRAREIVVPVTVQRKGNVTTFEGAFPLKRLLFAIGEGPWADTETVANEVQVRFLFVQRDQ